MHYIWNGAWPENRAPRIDSLLLDSKSAFQDVRLAPGEEYPARVAASDPDGDPLRFRWEVLRESTATQEGGDAEQVPPVVDGVLANADSNAVAVTAPSRPGAYRLFVYVYDDEGNAGHANVPFLVE
jgi:hypothetical protein